MKRVELAIDIYAPATRIWEVLTNPEGFPDWINGIQTVLITLGLGSAQESKQSLENTIQASNGTIVESLLLYSMAPNEGDESATEIAKQTAQQIN